MVSIMLSAGSSGTTVFEVNGGSGFVGYLGYVTTMVVQVVAALFQMVILID